MAKKPVVSPEEARREALKTALGTIERKYGQGAVMKLSDNAHVRVPVKMCIRDRDGSVVCLFAYLYFWICC